MHDIGPLVELVADSLNGVSTWRHFFLWLGGVVLVIAVVIVVLSK